MVCNPANLSAVRAWLDAEGRLPRHDPEARERVGQEIRWLLRLSGTNQVDVVRALQLAERFRLEEWLGVWVRPGGFPESPLIRKARAKWQLRSGDFSGFAATAREVPPADAASDSEWPLYWQAWLAGVDRAEAGRAAIDELEASGLRLSDTLRETALRLQLVVATHREDPGAYGMALGVLRGMGVDSPADHAGLWELLNRSGHADEARRVAVAYADPPAGGAEMERVGACLTHLGLWEEAIEYYARCCEHREGRARLAVVLGGALIQLERWTAVRELATQLRSHPEEAGAWLGYSRYLDGIACLAAGRTNEASGEFRRLLESPRCSSQTALVVGADLVRRRFPEVAVGLLQRRVPELGARPEYWRIVVRAAVQQSDSESMLTAARREWALEPGSLEAANDLAVALLLNDAEPELAQRLTRQVLDTQPDSPSALIHHALALLASGSPRAARPLLQALDEDVLQPVQKNSLAYARALLLNQESRPREMLQQLQRVQPGLLFPSQAARVEQLWQQASRALASR